MIYDMKRNLFSTKEYIYILQKKYLCVVSDDINTIKKKKSVFIARFHLKGKNMAEKYLDTQVGEAMQVHRCDSSTTNCNPFLVENIRKKICIDIGNKFKFCEVL